MLPETVDGRELGDDALHGGLSCAGSDPLRRWQGGKAILYRSFGKCGFEVSALGFGCMRLPVLDGDIHSGTVNETEAARMIRHAIDHGVNYLDTAYPYHHGTGETVVGAALQGGYRERIKLATKLPIARLENEADCDRILDEQLQKLQTDHVDVYLLHGLNAASWKKAQSLGVLGFLDRARGDGRICFAGFSFHDELSVFMSILDAYPWDVTQIMLNFMDINHQAGLAGLHAAAERGLAVSIMEPLRGGRLTHPPLEVAGIFRREHPEWSAVEWALRWVYNLSGVSVVLSGMSTFEQVNENMRISSQAGVGALSPAELDAVEQARLLYRKRTRVACTGCGYCVPCPRGVLIPGILGLYNDAFMYGAMEDSRRIYARTAANGKAADACSECGLCEQKCPQQLSVRNALKEAHRVLNVNGYIRMPNRYQYDPGAAETAGAGGKKR